MSNEYEFDAELAALKDEIAQRQDTEASLTKWVHDLGEELDALKEAVRPVVRGWGMVKKQGEYAALNCAGSGYRISAETLDALAALVGEE